MPVIVAPGRNPVIAAALRLLAAQEKNERKASRPEEPAEVARPKGEKAKPGKHAPTKDEAAWMDAIVRYGCIACRIDGVRPRRTAVHHLLRGGVRMGHKHTIGLCDPGHHQGGKPLGMVSRHPDKAAFEKKYGTETQLLKKLQRLLKKQPDGSYAPVEPRTRARAKA